MRDNRTRFSFLVFLLLVVISIPAVAQTTTATIRGKVTDGSGKAVAGAEINAVNNDTGFVHTIMSRGDGTFVLSGLTPGNYNIVVASAGFDPRSQDLTVLVGQTIDMDLSLAPASVLSEEITVIGGEVAVEMEATEVATQVTRDQIENLPQNDRNFMNFAALAPGVTLSTDPERKTFRGGAQSANQVNVFVDGVSFKNDVIQGGVVGQDSSRGNPFPQNAVQEFRVLTQNYSAEFQKSSSTVITAVTKSGTNSLSGEVFAFFQDNDLVDDNPLSGAAETFFERLQTGLSIGGPIIRDRMHYFFGYEGNDQDRESQVRLGGAGVATRPDLRTQLAAFEGVFPATFELGLFFGKLSFQPGAAHLLDLSGFMRDETDVRGFGGETSFERAEEIKNDITQLGLRYQLASASWLNEASISHQDFNWNPRPLNQDTVGRNYFGIMQVGGRDTEQDIEQQRLAFRDDLSFTGFEMAGNHILKVGANVDMLDYKITKHFVTNPFFNFREQDNWQFPFEAFYGLGNPEISGDNTEFGLYVQDEWTVTEHLLLNLGVRWDYESDMFPVDWVTPANVRERLAPYVDTDKYFTDGDDRDAIDDMFAPRLGFAYDLFANSRTVVFGGWGRYYDRLIFNNTLDERFRLQFTVGRFDFTPPGAPTRAGAAEWRPEFLSEAGLQQLLASGITGNPEAFLIENDTKAQYADQWNLGVRHAFGDVVASLSYGSTRSKNGFTFIRGNRNPNGSCCVNLNPLGFSGLIISSDDVRTWYDAIYLTVDKPFTRSSRWGGGIAYTHADSEQIGGDLFSLDFPSVDDYPRYPTPGSQTDRLTANAIVGLPFNFSVGALLNYGSGYVFNITDRRLPSGEQLLRGAGEGDAYLTLDLRLEYDFTFSGVAIGLVGELFNVSNDEVFDEFNGEIFASSENPNFGRPNRIVPGSQRRFQYGVRFKF